VPQGLRLLSIRNPRVADEVLACYAKRRNAPSNFAGVEPIVMGDRLNAGDILTLDRDFKHDRWRRNKRFRTLIPLE
jgi:hypothetical protein